MTEQAKVPAIRFAGFTDPWEQRKLGELFEESDERASDREILSVSVANGIYPASESDRETNPGASLANYKIVHFGDVVYNSMRMWQGAVDASRYDGIVSPAYVVARPNSEVYARFFARLLRQPMLLKQYQQVSQGNSKDTQVLKFDDFASIGISMPASENEQRRIGGFFDRLDSLITLHQRKYDKLVILKKSMLEKMFPKDGESVPEIRFAGFTDPWEQRKLGELEKDATLYMGRGRVISAKDMSNTPGTFPVYSSSALDDGRMGAYGKYMFNQELITWSIDGGGAVFYRRKHRFSVTNVSGYIAVNPEKISCKFLAYAMSLAHSRIKFDYTVKAHPSVIRSLYTMGIPISLQEQQVIGSFFSRLDELITLHQRKLELLRNIKKSLLDKMFV